MKCFWIFGHDYTNWSKMIEPYGAYRQQWRKCKKCNRLQYRTIGYAGGVNPEQVNSKFTFFSIGNTNQKNTRK